MPKKRANGEGDVCERRRWRMKRAKRSGAAPLAAPNGGRERQCGNRMKGGGFEYGKEETCKRGRESAQA